jgi:hypothetical protein
MPDCLFFLTLAGRNPYKKSRPSGFHFTVEPAKNDFASLIVYLADAICAMMGIKRVYDGLACRFYEAVRGRLNLTEADIRQIILTFNENKQKVEGLLAVI